MIAGFEDIHSGSIEIQNTLVSSPGMNVSPEKRSIGMVFQDYALFPHLSVKENLEFGIRKKKTKLRRQKVGELLELIGLEESREKYPHQLSGGQQQRIALARAPAPEPELLLLDEPFSNLDVLLRDRLAIQVRDILKELGTIALLVTHNQHEAFAVADTVGVLFNGSMQQWDSAYNIYHRPASIEVATFVGDGALLRGKVIAKDQVQCGLGHIQGKLSLPCDKDCEVNLLVRPEDILHIEDAALQAEVVQKSFRGPDILYQLRLPGGETCQALVSSHHNHRRGEFIGITPEVDNIVIFPKKQTTLSDTCL